METLSVSGKRPVKILILGDVMVGKTTLVMQYLGLEEAPEEENSIEEYRVRIKHDGREVDVNLCDLSPGATAPERRGSYPSYVNSIILCFSIADRETLKSVYNLWIHEARAQYGKLVPVLLVGLKSDARYSPAFVDLPQEELVERPEGEALHRKYNFYGDYMECSYFNKNGMVNVINQAFSAAMEN